MNQFTPVIASDYSDGTTRNTAFQLCAMEGGRLTACATVQFTGDRAVCLAVKRLAPRSQAIIRLARIYRSRSIPQVFPQMPSCLIGNH